MTPKNNIYYQHRYNGLYQVLNVAMSTVDESKWVVYEHVFPFDRQIWIRPYNEWADGRFREITEDELQELLKRDVIEFQEEIRAAKAVSK